MIPTPLVTTQWLAERLGRPEMRVLDCTVVMRTDADGNYGFGPGREEFEAGHVPGSVFVDVLGELADCDSPLPMTMPPAEDFTRRMEGFGFGDDTDVVLYDGSLAEWAADPDLPMERDAPSD